MDIGHWSNDEKVSYHRSDLIPCRDNKLMTSGSAALHRQDVEVQGLCVYN